jgi:hypothetical protein
MTATTAPTGVPSPALAVIGAGLGRFGTLSLRAAADVRSLGVDH